ncbi:MULTISPECIES: hypothetical protein [Vibrio]|jgi:hypothetical protein|uniref:hypothetical protein n=1 Tax=Vibrio TaxID=662 RepID=UPI000BFFDC01|nr:MULTISPECIES: hypothetical protein [unclassified Vibrio]PHJ43052.1 hypothetical protein AK965_03070 [Vibrio sp. PID17_43]RIZ53549.1 hypothetical protein AK966_12665 [Vibrio sp. PID23_8]
MPVPAPIKNKNDALKKAFLWLIIFDYLLLAFFLTQLSSLNLNSGTMISLLLVVYNILLVSLCYQRTSHQDSYILYPVLSATLLAFVCFLYFFFLV